MAQIRRRCLTLNDHTLINSYHPRQHPPQHPHSSSGSGCPRAQSFPLAPFVLSGDDSDSYTSIYISPEPSLSLSPTTRLFSFIFFYVDSASRSNGLCIKLYNKVIYFPELFRSPPRFCVSRLRLRLICQMRFRDNLPSSRLVLIQ